MNRAKRPEVWTVSEVRDHKLVTFYWHSAAESDAEACAQAVADKCKANGLTVIVLKGNARWFQEVTR